MDWTDKFDKRLETLHQARDCPRTEIDAAVMTYERLKTAQTIAESLLGDKPDQAATVAVFSELCAEARAEARSRHATRTDE